MEKTSVDTLIHPGWIIPVDDSDIVLENHSIAILDGKIHDIIPTESAIAAYDAKNIHQLDHHVLIPGLINTHTHVAMNLFRGLADDLPLMTWLNEYIWPAEQRWVGEEFVADGTRLAIAEMLKSGTTCFNDMYFFPDVSARVAQETGIRATVGLIVFDFPSAWGEGPDDYINRGLELHDQYRTDALVSTAFAPHAPYTVSDAPLSRIRMLADELEIPVHMHVHETQSEIQESLKNYSMRPLQRLQELGLISPLLVAVHMTQLTEDEIAMCCDAGVHVVHCAESNLKLGSGFCPVNKLVDNGINVSLGTDGAASNNDLDMMGEMRTASLLAKGVAQNAEALSALQTLRAATINGARALGIADTTGSLETGKSADIVAIDLDTITTQPIYHPASQIVYAAGREQVRSVWVNGEQLVANGQLLTIDEQTVRQRAKFWMEKIKAG